MHLLAGEDAFSHSSEQGRKNFQNGKIMHMKTSSLYENFLYCVPCRITTGPRSCVAEKEGLFWFSSLVIHHLEVFVSLFQFICNELVVKRLPCLLLFPFSLWLFCKLQSRILGARLVVCGINP